MRIPLRLPTVANGVEERLTKRTHAGSKRLPVDTLRFERQPAETQRKKDSGFAVRGVRVLVGAIGIATLLGACGTRAVPDSPAEPATTPARSIAPIDESVVSTPGAVTGHVAGEDNEADENETDENEVDEDEANDCVANANERDDDERDDDEYDDDEYDDDDDV